MSTMGEATTAVIVLLGLIRKSDQSEDVVLEEEA